jgi:phosphoglycerate dehydrogenase-like enzyme
MEMAIQPASCLPVSGARPKTLAWMSESAYRQVFSAEELGRLDSVVTLLGVRHDENPDPLSLLDSRLAEAEFLFTGWGVPKMSAELLGRLPNLRAIFHAAGSVRPFVTDEVWARGIRVTSAALVNARPVAEYTFAMVVLALKRVWPRVTAQREFGLYLPDDPFLAGAYGSTVGMLGLSRSGRLSRTFLDSLDVKVIAYDPTVSAVEAASLNVELVSLEEVFARSHVVTCHIPLLPETMGMLREEHFKAMRPGATFINVARGAIVRENELAAALQARPDLWAVLDVLTEEPPPPSAILPTLPNVLITPHLAGSLGPECQRMSQMMLQEIQRYLRGEPLKGEVKQTQLANCA